MHHALSEFTNREYEQYREAWELLRERWGPKEVVEKEIPKAEKSMLRNRMEQQMLASLNFVKRR